MSRKARKNVGVIGLGIIGSRVAAGLRTAGYQVYVWNRSARPAPNFLGSPAEIAESSEIIQIFVADAQALFDVVEAMSEVLTPKHIIVCNATVGPEAVLEAAQLVEARGAQFLDAPFTGSKIAAEKRQLVYYVGGSEPAFQRVRPILELTSKSIIRMGEIGHAATIKVVTNMISAVTAQVLAEALSIVQKAGLEPELLAAAIEQNACRSGVIDLKLPKMLSGDYEPHFSLKHMFKDVQLGIHMANALDIEIPATTVTAGVMYGALNQGWGDLDFSVLFKNYTPTEVFEELPAAIQHALAGHAALEATPAEESADAVEPEPEAPTGYEPETESGDAAPEPAAVIPPPPIVPTLQPPTMLSEQAPVSNGASMREAVPTEEASRIIEAVLAHVTHQRGETGGVVYENRRPSPAVETTDFQSSQGAPEEKPAVAMVVEPSAAESSEPPKPADAATPDLAEQKADAKPVNFVRRWFVGRSQG
ncbi:MAG: NAD(P)-dependent oxidoreductase [Chthoniobacter sp.]|uniref:NAD(P)-dependent oxidoreductase n=1 Tax=Chthoniobacter sp. TaxID=2510640 RepID=UPI0032A481F8